MAGFGCVVLLTVFLTIVVANSPIFNNDSVATTTAKPVLLLKNSTENATEKIVRAGLAQTNNSGNKEKYAEEEKIKAEFEMLLERRIPHDQLNREVNNVEEFWKKRNALADSEVEKLLGSSLPLSSKEAEANEIILEKKFEEYDKSLSTTEIFPPSVNFSLAKDLIEQSDIYKIIQKIPKGAALYNLLITSVPFHFMFYDLTYQDNLYFRFENKLHFKFSKTLPAPGWRLLSQLRNTDNAELVQELNEELKHNLSLTNLDLAEVNDLIPFLKLLDVLQLYKSLTSYKPNFVKTLKSALETLYEDNIMYAELGFDFSDVHELDGKTYTPVEILRLCETIVKDFLRTHKDFVGVRFIYVPFGYTNLESLSGFRKIATDLWEANPELIIGFGMVRIEDTAKPLSYWVDELLKFPKEIKFFFTAGMTNNWGTGADYDLLDAVNLNFAAIGEGLALNKHPLVLEQLRQKGVPVEFSPIAAQGLNFVKDLRNHPLTFLVATDAPLVIGNAAGTAWNATGLSYDWYEAYMAMTPRFCDIRCLKQFALNSLLYCTLPSKEKKKNIQLWQTKWDEFIDYVIDNYE